MNEEELHRRIKNAVVIVSEGNSFRVGDLTFCIKESRFFSVTGWTLCNEIPNLNKAKAISELNEIKALFNNMVSNSKDLERFINSFQIEYLLMYDYGMGGIEICREINGNLQWLVELK